ncbi:MAG: tetratricopeptide repeat protein [Candidatus Eisenbacteria bacterium]
MERRSPSATDWPAKALPWIGVLALAAATFAAYWPALDAGYIWDDDRYVTGNATLRSAEGLRRIWFDPGANVQYYPLVHTSFWVQVQLDSPGVGEDPAPRPLHLVNVLLHALVAVLVWAVLKALQVPWPWMGAAVFALHPVHVESVAWITERKNVLSGAFALGAALLYLRYAHLPRGRSGPAAATSANDLRGERRTYAAALVLFALALLSKTVTAVLPAVLLLLVWWKRGRLTFRDIAPTLPMFAAGAAAGLFTAYLEHHQVGARGAAFDLSPIDRGLIAGRAAWFYLGKLVAPVDLTFVYRRWQIDASAWPQYLYPAALAAGLAGLWIWRRRIGRGPLAGTLVWLACLFPALGFIDVYPMRFSFVADHFQYLASIAPLAMAIAAVHRLGLRLPGRRTRYLLLPAIALLLLWMGLTRGQTRIYHDVQTLWTDTLKKNPDAVLALNNLGVWHTRRGDLQAAYPLLEHSLRVDPDQPRAHENFANVLSDLGRQEEAIAHYRRALELARERGEARDTIHWNLGLAYGKKGMLAQAIEQFEEAARLSPGDPRIRYALAETLLLEGRRAEAEAAFRDVLALGTRDAAIRERATRALERLSGD